MFWLLPIAAAFSFPCIPLFTTDGDRFLGPGLQHQYMDTVSKAIGSKEKGDVIYPFQGTGKVSRPQYCFQAKREWVRLMVRLIEKSFIDWCAEISIQTDIPSRCCKYMEQ